MYTVDVITWALEHMYLTFIIPNGKLGGPSVCVGAIVTS